MMEGKGEEDIQRYTYVLSTCTGVDNFQLS